VTASAKKHDQGDAAPKARRRRGIDRGALLAAAAELFARKGYRATSLDDVASKLGVKKTSLYHYIDSKEDLLFGIYERLFEITETSVTPIASLDLPPDERLRRMVHAYVEVVCSEFDMATMVLRDESELSAPNQMKVLRRNREMERVFEAVVVEGQRRGLIRPLSPRLVVLAMFGMCKFVHYWFRLARFPAEQIASEFALILESGWLTDGTERRGAWPRATTIGEALTGPFEQIGNLRGNLDRLAGELHRVQERLEDGLVRENEKEQPGSPESSEGDAI
jgi:AcrR family transcriptional regulator